MQAVLLKARGLFTFPNNLSEIPEGALLVADNVIVDRNGVIEPRRGNAQYGDTFGIGTDRAKQLFTYKNRVLRHFNNILQFDNGTGTFTSFAGSYLETEPGLRIKSVEAKGNFYFTTNEGIKVISASDASQFTSAPRYIRDAGAVQALDVTGTVNYSTVGFLPPSSKVAYRITWAFIDANKNLVESAPSSRLVVTNYSTTSSGTVDLTFTIPSDITINDTQYFYRIYRTQVITSNNLVSLSDIDPGDEMNLVIEDFPTAAQLTARSVTVNDPTPEDFRTGGELLYTNPVSGDGILQSNFQPPIAKDIALFQNTVFYSNTQTKQQLNLALLSVLQLVSGTSFIRITQGLQVDTYTFRGTPQITNFTFDTQANTNDGGYFLINSANNLRNYFVWFGKSGATEITEFTFDTVANTTNGGYFLINSANDATGYFIWFDKTGSTPVPSAPDTVGRIGLRVSLVSLTTATEVATAVANVLPSTDFSVTTNNALITVSNTSEGATTDAVNGTTPVGGAFVITVSQQGVNPTVQPSGVDTVGRIPIFINISQAVTATDVAVAVETALNNPANTIDFSVTHVLGVITVTNTDNGPANSPANGIVPVGGIFAFVVTQFGTGQGDPEITNIIFDTQANTNDASYFLINNAQDELKYFVWFDKTGTTPQPSGVDTVGRIPLHANISASVTANNVATVVAGVLTATNQFTTSVSLGTVTVTNISNGPTTDAVNGLAPVGGVFSITVTQQGANFVLLSGSVSPGQSIDETARALVNSINNNIMSPVNAFYQSGPNDVPGLILLQARHLNSPTFSLTADSTTTGAEFNPILPTSGFSVSSTNENEPNALYYSKFQQPEAVPIVNKFNVGPKDKAILRILPLRDSLFVLKEDGIYRVTGQAGSFQLDPFDYTANLLAPDSAVVLNNQIYMLSTQGVSTVSDTGVTVISRPIENTIARIIGSTDNFKSNTFGVSYETDRSYLLWTITDSTDTDPTQCFRFNTFTSAWTRFPIAKTCGIVRFIDDILFLGPGDENFIEKERKDFLRTDYADREYPLAIPPTSVIGNRVSLSSVADVEVGDILFQTQNLTIYQFNQLLKKLDLDWGATYKNYFSTLAVSPGDNLRNALNNLALKMDTDIGLANATFFSSMGGGTSFPNIQTDFNIVVNLLNTASGAVFHNYPASVGTITFEAPVTEKIKNTNDVLIKFISPFIEGPVTSSRGIKSEVVWAPQAFGDPSLMKQVREGTFLFDNTDFYAATISYASDLSPDFEEVSFNESGIGDWGLFTWDKQNWGGGGSQVPLRTYIPRNKQKCRFLKPRFVHLISREKFALFGLSLTIRPVSERAYRS